MGKQKEIIVKFDNLVQDHPVITGKKIPVYASVLPNQLDSLRMAGKRGREAAGIFKKRLSSF
ncbi:MAG: hypothetical protein WC587_01320 [Candidatus Paceibacterota bacterium]